MFRKAVLFLCPKSGWGFAPGLMPRDVPGKANQIKSLRHRTRTIERLRFAFRSGFRLRLCFRLCLRIRRVPFPRPRDPELVPVSRRGANSH